MSAMDPGAGEGEWVGTEAGGPEVRMTRGASGTGLDCDSATLAACVGRNASALGVPQKKALSWRSNSASSHSAWGG